MLKLASEFKKHINLKIRTVEIDNLIFRLHYRVTFMIIMAAVAIVCAHEYIGERIRCTTVIKDIQQVVETFCFFMSTYTVVKDPSLPANRQIPVPGLGNEHEAEDVTHHAYYQWVPFFLFFQAICFYLPHLVWRLNEGGRIKNIVEGFKNLDLIKEERKIDLITKVQHDFDERIFLYRAWTRTLIFCEFLNLVNLIFQVYITDVFLGHQFMDLGPRVFEERSAFDYNPLDIVFPLATKCEFKKFGPSGSIQNHDTICILALNVINSKTFTILWFWYLVLFVLTCLQLLWRLVSFFAHSSVRFNLMNFVFATQVTLNKWDLITVMKSFTFTEWLFLRYLASNMEGRIFRDLLSNMAAKIRSRAAVDDGPDFILPLITDDPYLFKVQQPEKPLS